MKKEDKVLKTIIKPQQITLVMLCDSPSKNGVEGDHSIVSL